MSAYHVRQAYSPPTGARWRQGFGRDFHWRSGQARHFLPASRDRPSGKLHPRRLLGITVAALCEHGRTEFSMVTDRRYNFQTVFPSTIVRTARPFSFQAWNGELREAD